MRSARTERVLRLVPPRTHAAPVPPSDAEPVVSQRRPIERFAQYALREVIARGGMATVWRASAPDGTEVALKRMLPSLAESPRAVLMFSDEALLGMRLDHPRLVHTFELGVFENEPFMVMELVDGPSMSDVLSRSVTLMRPAAAVYVVEQLLEGLSALHTILDDDGVEAGVVHRDVSPNNLLVTWDGEVKLGDFGIALVTRGGTPHAPGVLQGKVGYMAPEQLAGDALDARADLFAAGVVLLELLTGRRAFARDHELATLAANYAGYSRSLDGSLPGPLARIIRTALAQHREERFPSARAFAAALGEARAELSLGAGREQLVQFLGEIAGTLRPGLRTTVRSATGARQSADHRSSLPAGAGLASRMAGRIARDARSLATGRRTLCRASEAPGLARQRELFAYRFGEPPCLPQRALLTPAATRAVLTRLARRRASGLLVARSGDREMRVFFDDGAPVFIASSEHEHLLGERLVRLGHLSASEVELAVERAARWDCPLGEALVDMGFVSARLVFHEIMEQMRARLRDLGTWSGGELGFVEQARPGVSAVRLCPSDFELPLGGA
ncbi:MAG: serine/threonine protein kinase [Polyangiaceae bacterium]|nr:serine/threonine protein kinase [Polyangiaceae bacterium]MCE7889479.1 serine/threonine protein kinase [Sorangiineae bacterium PRO1]MCL4750319.1 serine/threonine protein kinase [Myxococcales bacterium]